LAYHLVDLWSGQHLGPLLGPASIGRLAPHELRLLHVPFDLRTTRELRLNFSPEDPGG
jgi:hypothetical protein